VSGRLVSATNFNPVNSSHMKNPLLAGFFL
jgi:hypothetical protein